MALKDILDKYSIFSPFQSIMICVLSLPLTFVATHNLMQIFTAAIPPFQCRSNITLYHKRLPPDPCTRFVSYSTNDTENCSEDYGWEYDSSEYTSTVISEWNLVCQWESLKEVAQSVYMAGVLVGAMVYGPFADRFGRRAAVLWCLLQVAVMGTGASLSPNFTLYCVFRFLSGMGLCGFIINDLSLAMEWVPRKYRSVVSIFQSTCLTIGQIILAGLGYAIRDWRWLQRALSLPYFLFFILAWWVPESFRWQILADRSQQALDNLNRVARINGKKGSGSVTLEMLKPEDQNGEPSARKKLTPFDLFRTPVMRKITISLCMSWFSSSFCYFALAMDIQRFGLNIYLVQIVFGCSDLALRVLCMFTATYIGRRFSLCFYLLLAGIFILSGLAIPTDMTILQICATLLAKGSLSSAIICSYLYTAELYPTVLRQTGVGFTNMIMRLGGVVSPIAMMTKIYFDFLPFIIFGVVPIICAVPIMFLPETLNSPLLDTIEEVEKGYWKDTPDTKSTKTQETQNVQGTRL
uniref:Major facilitator superfamily (MFS) profile domain-containing protein n=1 Tax=Leptobrachium leishanense TaxID=445787 RepID=A0A8C5WLZ8_9ANUR